MADDGSRASGGSGTDLICVAAIAGAHGVRGEVRLRTFTETPDAVADFAVLLDRDGRRFEVARARPAKGGLVVGFNGIATRDQAQSLKGTLLHVERAQLPALAAEEYYHADLIGLAVRLASGELLGTIRAVHDFGAGALIEIALAAGGPSVMLPFTAATVPVVEVSDGYVTVEPPAGLLPGDEADP